VRVTHLEVCGFRSYGTEAQRLQLDAPLAVVHADNSQGKTSLAEAVEFLLTGVTSRRLLAGGSLSEFQDALRNAHLPPNGRVYVELGLDDGSGTVRVLRRELTCDYRGASDCTSTLTLDGTRIAAVTDAGLTLSDPPLAAPVLLEHTLRYAVSAKPGDRSDYFKAVLEVADLDVVRAEVSRLLAERDAAPRDPLLAKLHDAAGAPLFAATLDPLRRTRDPAAVEAALRTACHAAAPPSPLAAAAAEPLPDAAERLRQALQARQRDILPIAELRSAAPSDAADPARDPAGQALDQPADRLLAAAAAYGQRVRAVDAATAELLPLLQAALQVDRITAIDANSPADCPLCLTPDSLTAARVAAIRAQVGEQQDLSSAGTRVREQLRGLSDRAGTLARTAEAAVPAASRWEPQQRDERTATAARLGAQEGQLEAVLAGADQLAAVAGEVRGTAVRSQQALSVLIAHSDRLHELPEADVSAAADALRDLSSAFAPVRALHSKVTAATELVLEVVRPPLEAGSDTAGWAAVAELAEQPAQVLAALTEHDRRTAATTRLRQAAKQIDLGVQTVLDRRLLRMGGEIRRWWALLRPDELTTFDAVVRRGTGRKYLDVTAALAPQPATAGVVRNALAVLSNSQLNALGLSAFLARCQLLTSPLIVLDDPVPGSDREHRNTFSSDVVAALFDGGQQVLVTTHDSELARQLQVSHQHLGVDEFRASLVDARTGTQIVRTGDDFERLMLDASSQMHSPLVDNRRAAGNALRIAAERLAKHVIVAGRRRAGDATAGLAEYDNKNLRDLRVLATQHAIQPNEPGRWQQLARTLNDADHDTLDPPTPIDLKQCHATLRDLKKQHQQNDPQLTRS
jgi:hypothetical protein